MGNELNVRLLVPDDFSQMYRTFIDAFSRYSVKMDLSKAAFRERMEGKVNISYDHSVGVFDGEKLVGFIFNSINTYDGIKTAYNGGTGVIQAYWGQGMTKRMYEYIFPILRRDGIQRCVLEVITTNTKAINAYSKTGFKQSRRFRCFMLKGQLRSLKKPQGLSISIARDVDLDSLMKLGTSKPAMLDSYEQLVFNLKNETCLLAHCHQEIAGYLIFQHKTGRISQIAVKKEYRRQKIGTALLHKARAISENPALTILNIEESDSVVIEFFKSNGFVNELDQYEMKLIL